MSDNTKGHKKGFLNRKKKIREENKGKTKGEIDSLLAVKGKETTEYRELQCLLHFTFQELWLTTTNPHTVVRVQGRREKESIKEV